MGNGYEYINLGTNLVASGCNAMALWNCKELAEDKTAGDTVKEGLKTLKKLNMIALAADVGGLVCSGLKLMNNKSSEKDFVVNASNPNLANDM